MDDLTRLWDLLPRPEPSTVIRWYAQDNGRTRRFGDFATSLRELQSAVGTFPHLNFYVAPNPTSVRVGTRHTARGVSHWSFIFIDVDPSTTTDSEADPDKALLAALRLFGEMTGMYFDKATIIDSGRGRQAWIQLEPILLDDSVDGYVFDLYQSPYADFTDNHRISRWAATRTMGYWLDKLQEKFGEQYGCKVDASPRDLPRLMRCPATINQRSKRPTRLIQVGSPVSGIAQELFRLMPKEELEKPDISMVAPGTPWQFVKPMLTPKAKTFLDIGWEHPGRHDAMWHTAKCLQERGVSIEQARLALAWGNEMCRPKPLSPKDLEHALKTAYSA